MTQLAADPVTDDRAPDRTADGEPHLDRRRGVAAGQVYDDEVAGDAATRAGDAEVSATPQPMGRRQHGGRPTSGGEDASALAPTGRDDGSAGTGAHAQP